MRTHTRDLLTRGEVAKHFGIRTRSVGELDHWYLTPVRTGVGVRYRRQEVERLLTRKGVARRLSKSVTAVRSIEGHLLHPNQGPEGVRLFDIQEVDELIGKPLGKRAQSAWFTGLRARIRESRAPDATLSDTAQLRSQVEELLQERDRLRSALERLLGALEE